MLRDIQAGDQPRQRTVRPGRSVIAVIGIDDYAAWPRLGNAVSDATAVSGLFQRLGFVEVTSPLLDGAATGPAMRSLVVDELAQLTQDDSLVLFFAGHGHTQAIRMGETLVKTGYLIPVDGANPGRQAATWLRLDSWLSDIARLPPRHILVIIDACHSGIALGALVKWRDAEPLAGPIDELQARWSRRIITSALDDQRAMDGGPYPQHSLFTGCLIEGLRGGLAAGGRRLATGSEIGLYVQRRVRTYPSSAQTPDFGAFELDDRGEILVPILGPTGAIPESIPGPREPAQHPEDAAARPARAAAREDPADAAPRPAAAQPPAPPPPPGPSWLAAEETPRALLSSIPKALTTSRLGSALLEMARAPRRSSSSSEIHRSSRSSSKLKAVLQRPVSAVVAWGCLGLVVPLVGPIVFGYSSYQLRRGPSPPSSALRAGHILGAIGVLYTIGLLLLLGRHA